MFREGTFFANAHLSLRKAIEIIAFWSTYPTAPIDTAIARLGLSKSTIIDWFNFIRDVCQDWFERTVDPDPHFGGPNVVVEIDETLLFKAKSFFNLIFETILGLIAK